MRFIEDLRNRHKDKEVWVIGTSPTLDDLPDDFFDDKISIAVNWAFIAFPRCTYILEAHKEGPDYIRDNRPNLLKKCIFVLTPQRMERTLWFEDYSDEPFYMRWNGRRDAPREQFEQFAKSIMAGESCYYPCGGTCLHFAIEAAIVLGAKKVSIVGGEHRWIDHRWHAQKRGLSAYYAEGRSAPPRDEHAKRIYMRWRKATRWLGEVFKPYGVEIMRYHHKPGYASVI